MPNVGIDPICYARVNELLKAGISHQKIVVEMRKQGFKISLGTISNIKLGYSIPRVHPSGKNIRSDKKIGELSWREMVVPMKEMQRLKKKASDTQDQAYIEVGNGEPIGIINLSDLHLGAWSTDYDALIRITDEILSIDNLYIALTGDYGHYAIVLRNVLEVSDNLLTPELQTKFLEDWFGDIWHKVCFATWENHGVERQEKATGESTTKNMLSKKVIYFNGIGHVDIKVGDQIYQGAVSHKFRGKSLLNPVHGMMRYMRFEGVDREWALMGDTHTPGIAKYTDGPKIRVVANSGSIQSNSGYAKRYFSLKTHDVYPLLHFDPKDHMITPYWSVKEWLKR